MCTAQARKNLFSEHECSGSSHASVKMSVNLELPKTTACHVSSPHEALVLLHLKRRPRMEERLIRVLGFFPLIPVLLRCLFLHKKISVSFTLALQSLETPLQTMWQHQLNSQLSWGWDTPENIVTLQHLWVCTRCVRQFTAQFQQSHAPFSNSYEPSTTLKIRLLVNKNSFDNNQTFFGWVYTSCCFYINLLFEFFQMWECMYKYPQ